MPHSARTLQNLFFRMEYQMDYQRLAESFDQDQGLWSKIDCRLLMHGWKEVPLKA